MLEWFRSWATGIVIAVIIATIIEMILPNSTSKKYIKKPANTLYYKAFYRFLLHTRFYRA
ncbi:hypothetical protein EGW03_02815 [bacterium]|nr:hypothetical protein [bacterium]